jgi:hypothetical protein
VIKFSRLIYRIIRRLSAPYRLHFLGQINSRNEIGKWITLLASLAETKMVVEIGAWNGRGSSRMIMNGLRSKPGDVTQVIGLESNPVLYRKAKKFLSKFPNYSLLWGSIVLPDELDRDDLNAEEVKWLEGDIRDLDAAPYILDKLPDSIDLLILDGGEFSTYSEYCILHERVKHWIILDDIHTRKCRKIMSELSNQTNWAIVFQSHERHGTAVLKRLN